MRRHAFTLTEVLVSCAVLLLLGLLLLPAMKQRWNASGLDDSLNNVRQLVVACGQYRAEHSDRVPMRGTGYQNGNITGGWDTWHFAGKGTTQYWQSHVFDEHAHWRFLNPYLQSTPAPVPTGSTNTGSGATWNFLQGFLTPALRAAYSVKVCRSPGDVSTRQRNWPTVTTGLSAYDDVGTSYLQNMRWWDQPSGPPQFTAKFNAGSEAIRRMHDSRWYRPPADFVWIHDQVADYVSVYSPTATAPGEFGGTNMSVCGYLDGRAAYLQISPGAISGPGYTFGFPWP